nr:MAG TPA: hypothetical protein [Caudoviricetes sp.]
MLVSNHMKQVPSFGFSSPKGLVFYCLSCQLCFTGHTISHVLCDFK